LVTFITGIVLIFFATALMKMLVTSLKKKITEYREEYDLDDWYDKDWVVLYVIGDIVIIIIGIIAVAHIASGLDIIPWIVSPQGAFIAEVMK
jgi:succinate dehydrogenase/fumarate reductase cytochrome b subunit